MAVMSKGTKTVERPHKSERVAVRLTGETKRILEHAAEVTGRSLTDFVVDSAVSAAQQAIERNERLKLAAEDREVFLSALANPPAPNEALRAAAARHRKLAGG